jgi:hypothetical protein
MQLLQYVAHTSLKKMRVAERIKYLCYFSIRNGHENLYSMEEISELAVQAGFAAPKKTSLRNSILHGRDASFVESGDCEGSVSLTTIAVQTLDTELDGAWPRDEVKSPSSGSIISEDKYCGRRDSIDTLIKEINACYSICCFDACAVLLRRLFEILLILTYERLGVEGEIRTGVDPNDKYKPLSAIVNNAISNQKLHISSNKKYYQEFREMGNYSAHGMFYTATRQDIDGVVRHYRVMLDELFEKSGLSKSSG